MERKESTKARVPWWRGARGEWWVVAQGFLFALVVLGPRSAFGLVAWPAPYGWIASAFGIALMVAGGALAIAGLVALGQRNLTALPYPRDGSELVVVGPFRIVRNPIYSGLIFAAFGWALWVNGTLTLGYAFALFVFFDAKSRKEERWLSEKFPEYSAYQRRVKKLIPWVY